MREPDYPHNYEDSPDGLCGWCGGQPGLTGNCPDLMAEAGYQLNMRRFEERM